MNSNMCPVCLGAKRLMNRRDGDFAVLLDPDYLKWGNARTWSKEFWVCAGCLGTGRRDKFMERLLSGEFASDLETASPKPKIA